MPKTAPTPHSLLAIKVFGETLKLQILFEPSKGYFLGAANDLSIVCRDSEYFCDHEEALQKLKLRTWRQR